MAMKTHLKKCCELSEVYKLNSTLKSVIIVASPLLDLVDSAMFFYIHTQVNFMSAQMVNASSKDIHATGE